MRIEYDVVRLWEVHPTPILASGLVGLMPLVPLMAGQNLEELLEQATRVIEVQVELPQERYEVLGVTGLLASLKDVRVVEQFFRARSIMSLLSETPLFQRLSQEARLDTLRTALLRQLERRLGPVPEDLRQHLQEISDSEQLNQLLDAAVDSSSLEAFRFHLENESCTKES